MRVTLYISKRYVGKIQAYTRGDILDAIVGELEAVVQLCKTNSDRSQETSDTKSACNLAASTLQYCTVTEFKEFIMVTFCGANVYDNARGEHTITVRSLRGI